IDLGASSARTFTARLNGDAIELRELHRTPNRPVALPDGLHWNLLALFAEAVEALRAAGPLDGIGVDGWGVDYALLDDQGALLGLPYHYRDARTEGMVARAHERVSRDEAYAVAGIQTARLNTVFQLLSQERSPALLEAARIAMVPDLLAFW